jgi:hypothetical protein
MTNQHPITPPPELVKQWRAAASNVPATLSTETEPRRDYIDFIAAQAYQAGADQELKACLTYASNNGLSITRMRDARRPKPPSLKEQALEALQFVDKKLDLPLHNHCNAIHTIRRALEALPND